MLSLKCNTPPRWVDSVVGQLDTLLIDHAHCEKKAAGVALNLIFAYVDPEPLARALVEIVNEELSHFELVLDILRERGVKFRRLVPGSYGRKLNDLVRKTEPQRAIDRMLVAALIEARSCERFAILRDALADREPRLAEFYGSLFESEARHHSTYVRFARDFGADDEIDRRLDELATAEAEMIAAGEELPRMHS